MDLAKLKEIIDTHFAPPHLAQGMVSTRWVTVKSREHPVLEIKIDRRDV